MDRKPDIFEKIAYLGIAIATAKMYVDLHSGSIQSPLGPVLCFFIDFALYYIIYRIGRFVWCSWIRGRTRQEVKKQIEPIAQDSSDPSYKVHFPNKFQALYDYAFSHIGHLLEEDEKAELTRNIRSFATSNNPDLSPILKRRIERLGLYDLYHLCHAIGYHTGMVKNGSDIAHFIKVCFPAYTLGLEESTIRCKLTYIDCDYKSRLSRRRRTFLNTALMVRLFPVNLTITFSPAFHHVYLQSLLIINRYRHGQRTNQIRGSPTGDLRTQIRSKSTSRKCGIISF